MRVALAVGLVVLAAVALKDPIATLFGSRLPPFLSALVEMHSGRAYGSEVAPTLYQARVVLEIILGCALLATGWCMLRKKPRIGVPLGFGVLLFYLGPMDLILFYFEQFSTIIFVLFQFLLLVGLLYYRFRFTPGIKVKW